jgi:hypothetical protein
MIEVNRACISDEQTGRASVNFPHCQAALGELLQRLMEAGVPGRG